MQSIKLKPLNSDYVLLSSFSLHIRDFWETRTPCSRPNVLKQIPSIFGHIFYLQLFFLNNNAPFMLLLAVHDILKPVLDHSRIVAAITTDHWHTKIFASVVNVGNRGYEILLSR